MLEKSKLQEVDIYHVNTKRIRSQKHCKLCKNAKYGIEVHYKHAELNVSLNALAYAYYEKLGYNANQGKFACSRALKAHYEQGHTPPWLMEAQDLAIKKRHEGVSIKLTENATELSTRLIDGKITDEEYLDKVKLLAYVNMLKYPEKVSIKHALEAINLSHKQESLNVQKSESIRNWMKLISGKP